MFDRIAILGAGSWGMAMAYMLDKNGKQVKLWEFNTDDYRQLVTLRQRSDKLKNLKLAPSIDITNDLKYALEDVQLVILAIPSQFLRSVLVSMKNYHFARTGFVSLAKGIENSSLKRMTEIVSEELDVDPAFVAALSGPSHAEEVAQDMPTAVVVAGSNPEYLTNLQATFSNRSFRAYQSNDIIGVELGGALKNIIAIAAGITAGLKMGDNTMGALITRGLAEISRLGIAMGAQAQTFAGLSGIGDLVTTCSSKHSRNRYVGEKIGQGEKLDNILNNMSMVAEGVATTRSGYALAQKYDIEMPITNEVYEVLFNNKPPDVAVGELMERKLKAEIW
ncbi:MAG: NAD(P)-dependent glycerol-3-phosphate dehydrogenase [FCB group bacterium]|nr:NAD(P)-dependent glycerol-3-phosphate dehydrogenase [FCB group bacterium]